MVTVEDDVNIHPGAVVSFPYKENAKTTVLGHHCTIRQGSIIYADVVCGDYFQTGHHVLVREFSTFGNHVLIGTNTVIDGHVEIADFVKIESNCYIPTHTKIGSRVFIGPGVILTNDKYPLKMRDNYKAESPVIEDGVTIGGGATILPGVTIGHGSFIAAGSVVTKDVPPMSLVKGNPGRVKSLPNNLKELNVALSWREYL